ncbi:MAG: hypothetical protein AB1626_00145 [Candidatus Micrarchaeota archaeon]
MYTTIQLSDGLRSMLQARKMSAKESYEEVIRDLLEDSSALSDETKKELTEARAEVAAGRFKTLSQVKKRLEI